MTFLATTTVSVLRGTGTNRFGDEVDIDDVVKTGLPASILQKPVTSARPSSGNKNTPRGYTLRIGRMFPLQENDRIRDERTGWTYSVTTLPPSTNPVGLGSTRADLQRVS